MARREEAARGLGRPRRPGARGFLAAEDGTLAVFGLFILLAMLMAAGLAVDTMRHERERVRMQATLDRAVLAAADLEQRLDPEEVVRDYFEAAGILGALGAVSVDSGLNARAVTADASLDLDTIFLDMVGVDTLRAAVAARAEESVTDVEISLVLDVSNSMDDHDRLINLRRAAAEFVEVVMPRAAQPNDPGVTTISLVPYATSVNIGPRMMGLYNVGRVHDYSSCVLFDDDDYDSLALPTSRPLTQYQHFDPIDQGYLSGSPRRIRKPLCPRAAAAGAPEVNPLIPLGTDPTVLVRAIEDLRTAGSTEMDAGLRWGIAMLDPETRPVIETLVDGGTVAGEASGRPYDYRTRDVIKVVVLMTDGEPQAPYDLNIKFKSGRSNVWYDSATGRYSVLLRGSVLRSFPYDHVPTPAGESATGCGPRMTSAAVAALPPNEPAGVQRVAKGNQDDNCEPRWYWPRTGAVHDHPDWSGADPADTLAGRLSWRAAAAFPWLTNRELFEHSTTFDLTYFFLKPAKTGWFSSDEMDVMLKPWHRLGTAQGVVDRSLRLCAAAKDMGVTVFTIGFELDRIKGDDEESATDKQARARHLMSECATTPSHYFDVDGLEIAEAFHLIASQIDKLRLTR